MKTYLHLLENDEGSQAVTEAGCTRVCKIPRSLWRCSSESDMALSGHCTAVPNPGSMTELPGEPKQNDTRTHWLKVLWGWRVESRHHSWLKSCLGNPDVKPRFRTTGKAETTHFESIKEKQKSHFHWNPVENYLPPQICFEFFCLQKHFHLPGLIYCLKQFCGLRISMPILQMRKLRTIEPKRLTWGHPAPRWETRSPKSKSKRPSSNKSHQRFKQILRYLKKARAINLTQGKEFKGPGFDTWPQKIFSLGLTNGFYYDNEW